MLKKIKAIISFENFSLLILSVYSYRLNEYQIVSCKLKLRKQSSSYVFDFKHRLQHFDCTILTFQERYELVTLLKSKEFYDFITSRLSQFDTTYSVYSFSIHDKRIVFRSLQSPADSFFNNR